MFELGREQHKTINGKSYVIPRLERRLVEAYRDWIAEQIGDPFADVKQIMAILGASLDPDYAKELIEEARSTKKQLQAFSLGCPLAKRFFSTEIGQAELAFILLRDKQPNISREEAFQVWTALGAEEMAKVLDTANGESPSKKNAVPPAVAV